MDEHVDVEELNDGDTEDMPDVVEYLHYRCSSSAQHHVIALIVCLSIVGQSRCDSSKVPY